jgi:hypothetical protein
MSAMRLRVPFSDFASSCRRHGASHVYLSLSARGTECLAPTPQGVTLITSFPGPLDEAAANLARDEITSSEGGDDRTGPALMPLWVCGVAYRSREESPGLWIDIRASEPTVGEILERFFAELSEDGELKGLTLDELIRLSHPNVIIVPPGEIADFIDRV